MLTREQVAQIREVWDLDGWQTIFGGRETAGPMDALCQLVDTVEALRERLGRAEDALRKIADYVPTVRSGDAGEMARIARVALGAAGERGQDG